jgi:hypothetical protein
LFESIEEVREKLAEQEYVCDRRLKQDRTGHTSVPHPLRTIRYERASLSTPSCAGTTRNVPAW